MTVRRDRAERGKTRRWLVWNDSPWKWL